LETGPEWLDEEYHSELGMNDRLLDIHDVQALFEEKLSHFRDNPYLIFSDYRDDIKILSL
jgi:hypothetical protein